jgi:hypothetical protein
MRKTQPAIFQLLPIVFCLFSILLSPFSIQAQDSASLRISLLTCGQGEEIYSTFGHTALRITDHRTKTDLVYNYGTFDFEAPNFIYNFVKGKLEYFVSVSSFDEFMYVYEYEKRKVWEQELLLNDDQKKRISEFLQWNALPANRNYLYDFISDNCTTRIRDIIAKYCGDEHVFDNVITPKDVSYRDGINKYSGNLSWLNFGMNLLIGKRTDEKISDHRYYFLPEYLMQGTDKARVIDRPIAKPVVTIYDPQLSNNQSNNLFTPLIVFAALGIIIILLSFTKKPTATKFLSIFDCLFFISIGLLGFILLFMWFGTDHYWCKSNLNLLWAWPPHLIFIFLRNKRSAQLYFRTTAIASLIFLLIEWILPQHFPLAVSGIVAIIAVRAWFISKNQMFS